MVATAANGYATASNYALVITTGTVGGTSVVGYIIGSFSIEARSAVRPTVVDRTLDIAATGEAGVDFSNINGTLDAAETTGLATPTNITAGTITTVTTLTNLPAITANWLTAAGITAAALNGKGDWNVGKTGYALSAAGVAAIWDALTSGMVTVGSIGKKLAAWVVGTIDPYTGNTKQTGDVVPLVSTELAEIYAAVITNAAGADIAADIIAVKADTVSILSKLLKYVQLMVRKDAAIATDNATEVTAINANGGSGAGAFSNITDALEALRDRGDAAWITAVGFSTHTAADVWSVATRILTAGTNIVLAKGVGVTGFNDLSAAQVNLEVVDVLKVDTITEPGQAAPPLNPTVFEALGLLVVGLRDKITATASSKKFHNDAGVVIFKKALSDDTITYTEDKAVSGP